MHDQIQSFLEDDEITAFKDGKYVDEVREVYYSLISKGTPVRHIESVIHTVLKKLGREIHWPITKEKPKC